MSPDTYLSRDIVIVSPPFPFVQRADGSIIIVNQHLVGPADHEAHRKMVGE